VREVTLVEPVQQGLFIEQYCSAHW